MALSKETVRRPVTRKEVVTVESLGGEAIVRERDVPVGSRPWARFGSSTWVQVERAEHRDDRGRGEPHVRSAAVWPLMTA